MRATGTLNTKLSGAGGGPSGSAPYVSRIHFLYLHREIYSSADTQRPKVDVESGYSSRLISSDNWSHCELVQESLYSW